MKTFTVIIIIQSQHSISYIPHLTLCEHLSSHLGKYLLFESSLPNFVLVMLFKYVNVCFLKVLCQIAA